MTSNDTKVNVPKYNQVHFKDETKKLLYKNIHPFIEKKNQRSTYISEAVHEVMLFYAEKHNLLPRK